MVLDVYDDLNNGAVISTRRFVKCLQKKHDVVILSTGEGEGNRITLPGFYLPIAKNIMKKMQFQFAWPQTKLLKKNLSGVDIIHNQFSFLLGIKTVRVAKKLGVPVVSTFHVQPENMLYSIGLKKSKKLVRLFYRFFLWSVYNRSDAVICPSPFSERELLKHGLRVPSYVVSNGVPPQFKKVDVKRDAEMKDKFIVLSVGRLAREKRHDVLIEAINLSKHKDAIQLMILGAGPIKNEIEKQGRVLPNPPIMGYVPNDQLVYKYNIGDIYVHPSEIEIEGMTILEAMACGLPAIVSDSDRSATGQFAIDDRFIFQSGNAQSLADKIDYWFEHSKELKQAKKLYLKKAEEYSIDNSVRKLEEIYKTHKIN